MCMGQGLGRACPKPVVPRNSWWVGGCRFQKGKRRGCSHTDGTSGFTSRHPMHSTQEGGLAPEAGGFCDRLTAGLGSGLNAGMGKCKRLFFFHRKRRYYFGGKTQKNPLLFSFWSFPWQSLGTLEVGRASSVPGPP